MSIPNSQAAESPVKNFSYPDNQVGRWFLIHVDPSHNPAYVKKIILDAALTTEGASGVSASFKGMDEISAKYNVSYNIPDYAQKYPFEENLWNKLWVSLHNAGIKPVIQRQELTLLNQKDAPLPSISASDYAAQIKIFDQLPADLRNTLNGFLEIIVLPEAVAVIDQGIISEEFYFIAEGVITACACIEGEKPVELYFLGSGDTFGEYAALTGTKHQSSFFSQTKTSLIKIDLRDLYDLLRVPEYCVFFAEHLVYLREEYNPNLFPDEQVRLEEIQRVQEQILNNLKQS